MAKEEILLDKSGWKTGPWQNEPDKVEWIDEATGLDCLIVRHQPLGHLCGYVGVLENHPLCGVDYNDVGLDVHGGLTYSSLCRGLICHDSPNHPWWFGFDCAHLGDMSPNYPDFVGVQSWRKDDVYRDIEYVKEQCRSLARQLKESENAVHKDQK